MSGPEQPETHPLGVSDQHPGPSDGADGPKDVVEHVKDGEDDTVSIASSELTDTNTLDLLSLAPPPETLAVELPRELGLSTPGWFSDFTDYDVITIHGLRDNHSTVWKSASGLAWIQHSLFTGISVRQLDYMYAIDDSARIFQPDGVQVEARNLLRLYAENRRNLPETEINRPIIWVCHDIGGNIFKQVLIEACQATVRQDFDDDETWEYTREARDRIVKLSTAMVSLGCPHRTESIDRLEDEIHNLLSLPGPELKPGLVRKVKNIASQVDDINYRFLNANFFSRLLHINIFSLKSLFGPEGEKEPADAVLSESVKIDSEVADIGTNAKNDQGGDNSQNALPSENVDADGNADTQEAKPTTPSAQNTQPESAIHANPEQNNTLDHAVVETRKKKEAFDSGEGSRKALIDRAFDISRASPFGRYTCSLFDMFQHYNRLRVNSVEHSSLAEGNEGLPNDEFDWVSYFCTKFSNGHYVLKVNHDLNNSQLALLSMAPPVRLIDLHLDPELTKTLPFLDWIFTHQRFKRFDDSIGPYVLCIQGTDEDSSRMAMISQHVHTRYEHEKMMSGVWGEQQESAAFYFQFDRHDRRYNGIKPMLVTFLSKLTWHMWSKVGEERPTRRVFESLNYYHNWSLPALFNLFSQMRRSADVGNMAIILGCFDNCVEEERNWFLARVLEHQARTDVNYRLIITTTKKDVFPKDFIPQAQVISLDECPAPLVGYAIDEKELNADELWPHLDDVLGKRPALGSLASSVKHVLEQCQAAPYLGSRILEWLRHFGRGLPVAEIAATVDRLLPATPGNILSTFIHALPQEKRVLALKIYRWVKYAIEPLTVEALGHALIASTGSNAPLLEMDYEPLLRDITVLFGGIIVVKGGFVGFSNDSFYDTSISGGDDGENPALVHGLLAEACLRYLTHRDTLQLYTKLSVENYGGDVLKKPLEPPRDSMLQYAVRFWAEHYRLGESHRPIQLAVDFFQSTEMRNRWAEAHYLLLNPFTRINRGYVSSLPSMAALGLEDLVSRQVEKDRSLDSFHRDAWLAITEAARNGHESVVQKLLECVQVEEPGLQDAIAWATSSCNEGTLTRLLNSVRLLDGFTWPKDMLFRAAACGSEPLVSAIIAAGVDLNEQNDVTGEMAIHTAISWGHQGVVKLLLDAKVDLSVKNNHWETPLVLSADVGHPDIVQMLIDAGANLNDEDTTGLSAVNTAIYAGEHAALARLLRAGGDPGPREPAKDVSKSPLPLCEAAELCRLQCIRLLLEQGAHPCVESDRGSPLYLLCDKTQLAETCRLLIERGANPNQVYSDKDMLLLRALSTEDKELVGLLIDKGADVNQLDGNENGSRKTPLGYAIWSCELEMMEFLLQRGAIVNHVPEGAESSLFTATFWNRNIKKVEFLLRHKADLHWARSDGWTALHACYDLPEFLSLLLKHGADANKMAQCGTPLMMAARWNFLEALKILLRHRPLPELDLKFDYDAGDYEYGMTALMIAVQNSNHEAASLLLEAGAGLDDKLKNVGFILRTANPDDSPVAQKAMRDFLDRGAKVDHEDEEKNTALHGLTSSTPVKMLETLVDVGAPVDSPNAHGVTPLGSAVIHGNIPAAKYLISRGARGGVEHPSFGSLLHLACQQNYLTEGTTFELFELLVGAGANLNSAGPEPARESLLHAIVYGNFERRERSKLVHYIVSHVDPAVDVNSPGGEFGYPIVVAAFNGHHEILQYLVRHGANVNVSDELGRTPLHFLTGFGRWRFDSKPVRVLLKAKADIRAADKFGRTALHWAAGSGDEDFFEMILKSLPRGYDVNVRDNDGWTPLMWVCRTSYSHPLSIIDKLVTTLGADIFPRSTDGEWSAMKLACFSDQEEDIKKLLQPIERESQQDGKYGTTEAWDAAFHSIPPAPTHSSSAGCNSCIAGMIGKRYKCTVCADYDLCFKCFPSRTTMHDAEHELKEFDGDWVVDEENSVAPAEDDGVTSASDSSEEDKPSTDTDDEVEYDSEVDE